MKSKITSADLNLFRHSIAIWASGHAINYQIEYLSPVSDFDVLLQNSHKRMNGSVDIQQLTLQSVTKFASTRSMINEILC